MVEHHENLVFLPDVGGLDWLFEHQIAHLADVATTTVLVLDQQTSRSEMAHYVLDHAPQEFSLVGHSMGGWVAQEVAARAPERVAKLFLCDTWAREPRGAVESIRDFLTVARQDLDEALNMHFNWLLHPDRYLDTEFCTQLQRKQRGMSTDGYIRQLESLMADYSTETLLPAIAADTLVIHGRQDRVIPESEVRFLARSISGAALALIEDAGHCSPIEQPQAFTALLRLWLTRPLLTRP